MMSIQAGDKILAEDIREATRKLVARGRRTSDSTAASGGQGVLRLDDIPITGGRGYWICTSTLLLHTSVANDRATARMTYTTDGSVPTSASATGAIWNTPNIDSVTDGTSAIISFFYYPAVDETFSVLLWTQRLSGTGLINLITAAGAFPIDISIFDIGEDPGDTGTDI